MVKLKGKLSGICTMVWADLDSLFSAVCVVRWSLKKNMHCFCHYFTIMKRKKKLQNYGKYSSLLGNLSNYHSIGTQTHSVIWFHWMWSVSALTIPSSLALPHALSMYSGYCCVGGVFIYFPGINIYHLFWSGKTATHSEVLWSHSANQAWWCYLKTQQTHQSLHSMNARLAVQHCPGSLLVHSDQVARSG